MKICKSVNTLVIMKNSKIKKLTPTAHSEWVDAYFMGKNCYASGEYSAAYEDKAPYKPERKDEVSDKRSHLSSSGRTPARTRESLRRSHKARSSSLNKVN